MRRLMTLPEAPERPPATREPSSFWLVPGLTALLASLALYRSFVNAYPRTLWGALDLRVYLGAGDAVRHGLNPYHLGFTGGGLPYTYPPITLPFSAALSTLGLDSAHRVMEVATLVAAGLVAWSTMGLLGYRRSAGRLGLAAAALAGAVWLEPFQQNANLGQINVILMALVVVDLAQPDTRRWKGIGVGLAAGAKLVPGIFIAYLLLTRRYRAALVALGTFVATVAVGFAVYPHASAAYWGGQFLDTKRVATVAGIGYIGNQSVHGALARTGVSHADLLFYPLAALLLLGGLVLAALAARRGGELTGLLTTAVTGLLVSPIAWTHHWVWIMPILMYAWAMAARLAGRAQVLASLAAAALTLLFSAWPYRVGGPTGVFVPYGVLWDLHAHHGGLLSISPVKHLVWEMYTLTALAMLVFVALWAWRGRRGGGTGASGTNGGRPVTISSRTSPAEASGPPPSRRDLPLSNA